MNVLEPLVVVKLSGATQRANFGAFVNFLGAITAQDTLQKGANSV